MTLLIPIKTYLNNYFNIYSQITMLEGYIDILEQAIIENVRELEEPSREYTMSETKWMQGYTQALKDVLTDLMDQKKNDDFNFSALYKFNLN